LLTSWGQVRPKNISCHGTFSKAATYLETLNETGADGAVKIEGVRDSRTFGLAAQVRRSL